MIIPVGVTTRKKTKLITNGDMIFPKNKPNLNHKILNGVSTLEFLKPSIRNTSDTTKDQILKPSLFTKG